ncbi:MAG: hypothetical protein AABX71_01650, partial [Nanoarchaeota archaeon]
VEILKQAPDFGIHGCKRENLDGVLSGESSPWGRGYFVGHYFLVGEEEKNLPDKRFLGRLEESVFHALAHSHCELSYSNGKFSVDRTPCLVLLVEKGESISNYWRERDSHFSGCFFDSRTFPIAEDNVREFVEIKPVIITSEDLKRINCAFKSYMRRKNLSPDSYGFGLSAEYFALKCMVNLAVKRIAEQLKPYLRTNQTDK